MKIIKRYSGMSVVLLGIAMLASSHAAAWNGYPPGTRGTPGSSWGYPSAWRGDRGAGSGFYPRYMSEEELAMRRSIQADREAISAMHREREAARARRDNPWGNMQGWPGAPGRSYRRWDW